MGTRSRDCNQRERRALHRLEMARRAQPLLIRRRHKQRLKRRRNRRKGELMLRKKPWPPPRPRKREKRRIRRRRKSRRSRKAKRIRTSAVPTTTQEQLKSWIGGRRMASRHHYQSRIRRLSRDGILLGDGSSHNSGRRCWTRRPSTRYVVLL